jgi:hypothetical protein
VHGHAAISRSQRRPIRRIRSKGEIVVEVVASNRLSRTIISGRGPACRVNKATCQFRCALLGAAQHGTHCEIERSQETVFTDEQSDADTDEYKTTNIKIILTTAKEQPMDLGVQVPTRCFWISFGSTRETKRRIKVCILRQTWPTVFFWAYPKVPGPDTGPDALLAIEGVKPEVMHNLDILDAIQFLSNKLGDSVATEMQGAVKRGLASIQQQLPEGIELA